MQAQDQIDSPAGLDTEQQLMLRLKRFALMLTGDDRAADDLVVALAWENMASEGERMSAGARDFAHFGRLYEIWVGEGKQKQLTATLFQPGRENEAIRKGLDPSIARVMGKLSPTHRAVLLLVYGESFSYDATARLLGIDIQQLMRVLGQARLKFNDPAA